MNTDMSYPQVGQVLLGTIGGFSNAGGGAMVMLPRGVKGHIPRKEITWLRRMAKAREVFQSGQEVKVKVIAVKRSQRGSLIVTLSCRALQENPWNSDEELHPVDSRSKGKVVGFLPFGATVELASGFQALLHNSEITWLPPAYEPGGRRRRTLAEDFFKVGDTVEVVIQRVDAEKQKIWVSHRLTEPCPWDRIAEQYLR